MTISRFYDVYDPSELIVEGKDILENKGRLYFNSEVSKLRDTGRDRVKNYFKKYESTHGVSYS